jgi:LDH2 family malate/lactate/ureidoglycolate dehydrogenase
VAGLLCALDARPAHAQRVAHALVDAELCGARSHGVRQLPYYAGQIRRGELRTDSDPSIDDDHGALVVVDGGYGFGHVVAWWAANLACNRAVQHGVGVAAVRHANHIGRLGEYTEQAAARRQIGMLLADCEGGGLMLAPSGGRDRRLANNPISIAVPGPDGDAILLDFASSVVAESRVLQAAERGAEIPAGWVLDMHGAPSREPKDYLAGGSLLPLGGLDGGHKGYAMIVLVELLVGLLSGGPISGPDERVFSNGFVFIALRPDDARSDTVRRFIAWVKSSPLREGAAEILIPGEPEARARRRANGVVELDAITVESLEAVATRAGAASLDTVREQENGPRRENGR